MSEILQYLKELFKLDIFSAEDFFRLLILCPAKFAVACCYSVIYLIALHEHWHMPFMLQDYYS